MKKNPTKNTTTTGKEASEEQKGNLSGENAEADGLKKGNKAEQPLTQEATPSTTHEKSEEQVSEVAALKDQLLRLQADFENYRKRMDREKKDWALYAGEKVVQDLLPAIDSFERGLANAEKDSLPAALLDGFRLVYNQLLGALSKAGATPIDAEGQVFDPNVHEAISHLASETVPEGTVIAQTRRGYKMGERLLRAAQVVVSSGASAGAAE